jgi:phage-related protein
MRPVRNIFFFENYALNFINSQTVDVRKKIYSVLNIIQTYEKIPSKFFRNIEKALFEVRIEYNGNIYRIFCCFDTGKLVVLFNGFQKKTQKTPAGEIEKAKKIMDLYFSEK